MFLLWKAAILVSMMPIYRIQVRATRSIYIAAMSQLKNVQNFLKKTSEIRGKPSENIMSENIVSEILISDFFFAVNVSNC